jgi:hypothetical protein
MEAYVFDLGSAKVKKLIVHQVGNKLNEDGVSISSGESPRSEALDELLLKCFLIPVLKRGQQYHLFHESDLNLNLVHHYSSQIFADVAALQPASEAIARHLYSASTHPNIGGGEFLVILFDDILVEGEPVQALGLFRVESRSNYLDVSDEQGAIRVDERTGVPLEKVQKGAIVLADDSKVFVLDNLGQKTKYWMDDFLKASLSQTPKTCAKVAGALLKAISGQVESPTEALEFGRQLEEQLAESEEMTVGGLKDFSGKYISEDEVNMLLESACQQYGMPLEDDVRIPSKQLNRYAKDVVTRARIAEGVSLLISDAGTKINSIDVKQTDTGFQALLDIRVE